jgi:hypothetical protein
VKRWRACCLAVELGVWPGWSIALAEKITSPNALEQLSARLVTLSVIKPHLSTPEHPVAVDYLAFPAPVVISATLGLEWEAKTKTIEFRALDGYASWIDVAGLANGKAYMAFARADRSPFTVDNLAQNEKKRSAGPVLPYQGQQRRP